MILLQGGLGNHHLRNGGQANPKGQGGQLGRLRRVPPGKVNGRPRRCPLRSFGLQTASCDRICYHGCPSFSHPSGHKQGISPAPPPLGAAVGGGGAGEDLDWPWGRSVGTGRVMGPSEGTPRPPQPGLVEMTKPNWLRAQGFKGWAWLALSGFLQGTWEQLGEVVVLHTGGDCYSLTGEGKLRHTAVCRGENSTTRDFISRVQRVFPSLHEGISSKPSSSNPCGLCPSCTEQLDRCELSWLRTQPAKPLLTTVACGC